MSEVASTETRTASETKFVWLMTAAVVFLAAFPALFALITSPAGRTYTGFQYNTDDHMVYAAWMRQAMDGRFFFDNRFTTDPQPGLTVHVYFFALGLLSKVTGIQAAALLSRLAFSGLFVWLLYRISRLVNAEVYSTKLAVALGIVGGGLGFTVWHTFGQSIVKPSPLSAVMLGRLPTDVWQPEGFVFPSMLTNSLFMVSLCLILIVFLSFLKARDSAKAVLPGAVALGLLMNIHSYDVLLVAMVMLGLLTTTLVQRQLTRAWLLRSIAIACGVIPAALWFVHVLREDPVFQARAATETYSPNFRQVFFGYVLLMALGYVGSYCRSVGEPHQRRRLLGLALSAALFLTLFVMAANHADGYFLSPVGFAVCLVIALASVALASDGSRAWNLVFSWAVVGTLAIYFPGLFQRKLAMGLSIPWSVLSAYGLHSLLKNRDRSSRNLVLALSIVLLGATSIRWFAREIHFIRTDVANTGRHPVYLNSDVRRILNYLDAQPGRKVVLAIPGTSTPILDESGNAIPDELQTPQMPDLSPFISGFSGAYTYAGHWSETPHYGARAAEMYRFFLREPIAGMRQVMSDPERKSFVQRLKANYVVLPAQEAYPELPLISAETLGHTVVSGTQFSLVALD